MLRTALLILLERQHHDKQQEIALAYAAANQLHLVALCHHLDEVVAMLLAGTIRAVVSAVDPGHSTRSTIEGLGGVLHVAREQESRIRRDVNHLAVRMAGQGMDWSTIAKILEVPTRDVREAVMRAIHRRAI